jgi:type I restriction enzyme S subunit
MRWYGEGPFHRELKPARRIAKKSHFVIKTGDVIYNKLFAWKGSFGIVPSSLDGMFVSDKFPTYELDRRKVDERFLGWYFKSRTLWEQAGSKSTGSAAVSKLTLNPPKFLRLTIALPCLEEQRRLVMRIESLWKRISESQRLGSQIAQESGALLRSLLRDDVIAPTPMRELVTLRRPDVRVEPEENYQFAGVKSFGRGVFRGPRKRGSEFSYRLLTRLNAGDFVYPKLMAWEGAFGVVPSDCHGFVVSPEFPVFSVDVETVLPEVLHTHFTSPDVWPVVSGSSTGTNVRRRRLHPETFLDYRFPLPTRKTQVRLRDVRNALELMSPLLDQSVAELNALLPSILDRAFRGQL